MLDLQRLAGNRKARLVVARRQSDRRLRRHALTLDELKSADEEELIQRATFDDYVDRESDEYKRIARKADEIEKQARKAIDEMAGSRLRRRTTSKYERHVGKAYKRKSLPQPGPWVRVRRLRDLVPSIGQHPDERPREVNEKIRQFDNVDQSLFRAGADRWAVAHRNVVGRHDRPNKLILIGDATVDQGSAILKKTLLHEATHALLAEADVLGGIDPLSRYKNEFEAYWRSGQFAAVVGEGERAERIRTHIVGAHADDANTVYVDIRDWYWAASDKDRAEVDQYRVRNTGDFKWWHWNIHARVVFSRNSEYDDERKLKEWEKLSTHEQGLIRQDGELRGKVIGGLTRGVGSKLGQLVAGRAG